MKKFTYPFLSEFRIQRIREVKFADTGILHTAIDSATVARDYWYEFVAQSDSFHLDKEHLVVVVTNTKLLAIGHHLVTMGSLNETVAHPREIFRPALICAGYAILVMHNHPSGDPAPSASDRRLTKDLQEAARILKIELLDHVIIGGDRYYSFRESGLM